MELCHLFQMGRIIGLFIHVWFSLCGKTRRDGIRIENIHEIAWLAPIGDKLGDGFNCLVRLGGFVIYSEDTNTMVRKHDGIIANGVVCPWGGGFDLNCYGMEEKDS